MFSPTASLFAGTPFVERDPYFSNTSLLIKTNGVSGSGVRTTFFDGSANNFRVTPFSTVHQGCLSPYIPTGNWSTYLDGTGDYLSVNYNAGFDFGTGDFTVEGWFYRTDSNTLRTLFSIGDYTSGLMWRTDYFSFRNTINTSFNSVMPVGVWFHAAVTRSGSSLMAFINGAVVGTYTVSGSHSGAGGSTTIGTSAHAPSTEVWNGYISNFRIVKGTALYTGTFTPPTSPLTAISGTLLLTCQDNRFIDRSTNNFTLQRFGNVSISGNGPFGVKIANTNRSSTTGGIYINGAGYLTSPSNSLFQFGTGDYTVEGWFYRANDSGSKLLFNIGTNSTGVYWRTDFFATGAVSGDLNTKMPVQEWFHAAVTRSSGSVKVFINGVEVLSGYTMLNCTASTVEIGYNWQGYISNFRVIKGTAAYTTNFTPPTVPLAVLGGTSLLAAQSSSSLTDSGPYSFTLTKTGNVTPAAVSPSNTKPASPLIYGGSAYFNGSNDYLTTPSTSGQLGSGDFTVEAWVYPIERYQSYPCIWSNYSTFGAGTLALFAGHQSSSTTKYQVSINGSFPAIQSTETIIYNAWTHLAVVRSSGVTTLYVNGVANGTHSSTATLNGAGTSWIGTSGDTLTNSYFNGRIANLRVIAGTAAYTGNFTPPTSPRTAIAGTKLLLDFDNAGIYDATGKNNLEAFSVLSPLASDIDREAMQFSVSSPLNVGASPMLYLSGDFTLEFWINTPYSNDLGGIAGRRPPSSSFTTGNHWVIALHDSVKKVGFIYSTAGDYYDMGTYELGTWSHHAITRSGSTVRTFRNGTLITTATSSSSWSTTIPLYLGRNYGSYDYYGSIRDFRLTRGVARYTASFTAPTTPFPVQ